MPDYKQLKNCRREVVMLKTLWDMIALVNNSVLVDFIPKSWQHLSPCTDSTLIVNVLNLLHMWKATYVAHIVKQVFK